MAGEQRSHVEILGQVVQVVSVVIGVVISVLSFNITWQKEAEARRAAALKQEIEAEKPFLILRQQRYQETLQTAGVLANPEQNSAEELQKAEKRFWELYWSELALVEGRDVEKAMIRFGDELRPTMSPTSRQAAAYHLSHALRDSLFRSWRIKEVPKGFNP